MSLSCSDAHESFWPGPWLGRSGWVDFGVPLLLLKLRDTTLRGLGRDLGGAVGPIWGVPLFLLKLRDTSLRGLGCGLGGP